MISPEIARALAQSALSARNGVNGAPMAPAPTYTIPPALAVNPPPQPVVVPQTSQMLGPVDPANMTEEQKRAAADSTELNRELSLRDQQVRESNGDYGVQMPSGPLLDNHGDPSIVDSPEALQKAQQLQRSAETRQRSATADKEKRLLQQQANIEAKEAKDNAETNAAYSYQMQQAGAEMQQVRDEVQAQSQQRILHYQQTQQKMAELAAAEPKDLYGQAGVDGILGRIAVFLGGAGMNGFHENRNLQYIQQLANNNIAQEKRKFDYYERIGEGDRTMYGMLMNRLQNESAVHNTMHTMALEAYKSQLLANAGKYADKAVQIRAQQQAVEIDKKVDEFNNHSEQALLGQQQHTLDQAIVQRQNEMKQAQMFIKAGQARESQRLDGFWGFVPKTEHKKLSEITGGARNLVQGAQEVAQMLRQPNSISLLRSFFVKGSIMFVGARKFLDTGTRIEAGEQKILDTLAGNNTEFTLDKLSDTDLLHMASQMEAVAAAVTKATYNTVKAAAPDTIAFNSADPLWGQYNPRTYQPDYAREGGRLKMTTAGQAALADAPKVAEPQF